MPGSPKRLTTTQNEIIYFIRSFKQEFDGIPPSIREIAEELGMGSTSVAHQLDNLEQIGLIRRRKFLSRSIELPGGEYKPPPAPNDRPVIFETKRKEPG